MTTPVLTAMPFYKTRTIAEVIQLPQTQALARKPSYFTIIAAIKSENLPAKKHGRDWFIVETHYLEWLKGFPYKPGRKTQ